MWWVLKSVSFYGSLKFELRRDHSDVFTFDDVLLILEISLPLLLTSYVFCLKVEDIVDTGNTLSCLIEHLKSKKASSVSVCTLLDKPSRRKVHFKLVGNGKFYSGFEVSCFLSLSLSVQNSISFYLSLQYNRSQNILK